MRHEFVRSVPETLEKGVLYISIEFTTCVHLCACGCGREVVTPLSPTDWELRYDGETVSLSPSIGNWSFECRSHYLITAGKIRWAEHFSEAKIEAVRKRDQVDKVRFYERRREAEALEKRKPQAADAPTTSTSDGEERPSSGRR
jgi:hypothetical protein